MDEFFTYSRGSPPGVKDRLNTKPLIWGVSGVALAALVAANPFYAPDILFDYVLAAWGVDLLLVFILSASRLGARIGAFISGLLLAIPCFAPSPPLMRALLMCTMCLPLAIALMLVVVPPIDNFRTRLAYLCSWGGACRIGRRARGFDRRSFLQLILATAVFAAALAVVKATPRFGPWLPVRWLAGGIMLLAAAEMGTACLPLLTAMFGITVPGFMRSPWRAASISEFWTKRWNIFASFNVFRPYVFAPLSRYGAGFAMFAAFVVSAIAHALIAFMAIGRWGISLACGAFFLVQPLFIAAERRLGEKAWPPAARHAWTLGVLAITCPLFVEPLLQVAESSWGAPGAVLRPTLSVLGFVIIFGSAVALASFIARPAAVPPKAH